MIITMITMIMIMMRKITRETKKTTTKRNRSKIKMQNESGLVGAAVEGGEAGTEGEEEKEEEEGNEESPHHTEATRSQSRRCPLWRLIHQQQQLLIQYQYELRRCSYNLSSVLSCCCCCCCCPSSLFCTLCQL